MKKSIVVSLALFLAGCGSNLPSNPEVQNPQTQPTPVVTQVTYSLE